MECPMRYMSGICVIAIAVAAGACSRQETPVSGNAFVTPGAAPASQAVPVATVGRAEAAAPASTPAAVPAAETWREVTIPAGTSLPVVLDTSVGSDTSR